jgi:hypothetical protein
VAANNRKWVAANSHLSGKNSREKIRAPSFAEMLIIDEARCVWRHYVKHNVLEPQPRVSKTIANRRSTMSLIWLPDRRRFYRWLFIFAFGAVVWAVAQEKPQSEKRYVRWRLIEVARKSLADSILAQLQQGVSFQKLARQHSLHASAKAGGEIGWTALDTVDSDFKTALASLPIRGTSAILQKEKHFFILYKMNELAESGYRQ